MGRKCRRYAAQKACPGIIYSVYIVYIYYNYNPSYYYIVNLVIIYIYTLLLEVLDCDGPVMVLLASFKNFGQNDSPLTDHLNRSQ